MSDDFLPKPTLGQAMMSHPFKSILLLGGVWMAGAFVGKKTSFAVLKKGGQLAGAGISKATTAAAGGIRSLTAKGGSNYDYFDVADYHQLQGSSAHAPHHQEHGSCLRCGSHNHYTGNCG